MAYFLRAAFSFSLILGVSVFSQSAHGVDERSIEGALKSLRRAPTGEALLRKAMSVWKLKSESDLLARFRWGSSSKTDAVLIRHYDSQTGEETREREVTVYLRQAQPMDALILDLAHELVHATSRPSWDPYDPDLTASGYIRSAIEGEGGEVEAVRTECQVSLELFGQNPPADVAARCRNYHTADAAQLIRKDFYRVGKWAERLRADLKEEGEGKVVFPLLSEERPALYSSTGGAPYPVSLLEEYRQMTQVACENSRKRERSLKNFNESTGREPAADTGIRQGIERFLARRCR